MFALCNIFYYYDSIHLSPTYLAYNDKTYKQKTRHTRLSKITGSRKISRIDRVAISDAT